MKNEIGSGRQETLTAPYNVKSGDGALVGSIFGVALGDADQGNDMEFKLVGSFDLPKAAVEINQGAAIYWNAGARIVTNVADGNVKIGAALAHALEEAATVNVRLNGSF